MAAGAPPLTPEVIIGHRATVKKCKMQPANNQQPLLLVKKPLFDRPTPYHCNLWGIKMGAGGRRLLTSEAEGGGGGGGRGARVYLCGGPATPPRVSGGAKQNEEGGGRGREEGGGQR